MIKSARSISKEIPRELLFKPKINEISMTIVTTRLDSKSKEHKFSQSNPKTRSIIDKRPKSLLNSKLKTKLNSFNDIQKKFPTVKISKDIRRDLVIKRPQTSSQNYRNNELENTILDSPAKSIITDALSLSPDRILKQFNKDLDSDFRPISAIDTYKEMFEDEISAFRLSRRRLFSSFDNTKDKFFGKKIAGPKKILKIEYMRRPASYNFNEDRNLANLIRIVDISQFAKIQEENLISYGLRSKKSTSD